MVAFVFAPTQHRAATMHTLRDALDGPLAPLTEFEQFIVYRLEQDQDGSLDKVPLNPLTLHPASALDTANWLSHENALAVAEQHNYRTGRQLYGVGFTLTQGSNLWCVDVDGCFTPDGRLSRLAQEAYDAFPGAAVERSVSGRGIHIWATGPVPAHAKRYASVEGSVELYTSHRFIALCGDDAHGYAGNDFTDTIGRYAAHYFPPKENDGVELLDGPCKDWNGPRGDTELIAAAMVAEPVQVIPTGVTVQPNANFGDLWTRNVDVLRLRYPSATGKEFDASKADAALAKKLAFWTGRDVARMERLMHASALVRDKWQKRRGYLTETVLIGAQSVRQVYGEDDMTPRGTPEYEAHQRMLVQSLLDCFAREKAQQAAERFRLLSCEELIAAPPLKWLVRNVLPQEGLAALYGPSGSGKSFLAIDIAVACASPHIGEWFGNKVNTVPVTYLALEGGRGVGKRLQAWRQTHNKPMPSGLRFIDAHFDMTDKTGDVQALATIMQNAGQTHGLTIIDTLARAAAGTDENDGKEMGLIISKAAQLQREVGGLVLVVHHTGKTDGRGLRGHSSLFAALDAAIEVTRNADNEHAWTIAKSKDGADGKVEHFDLKVVTTGFDEDGPITSCVIGEPANVYGEGTVDTTKKKPKVEEKVVIGDNNILVYEAIKRVLKEQPVHNMDAERPAVPWTVAEIAAQNALSHIARNKPRAVERALSFLKSRRFVWEIGNAPNFFVVAHDVRIDQTAHETPLTG